MVPAYLPQRDCTSFLAARRRCDIVEPLPGWDSLVVEVDIGGHDIEANDLGLW